MATAYSMERMEVVVEVNLVNMPETEILATGIMLVHGNLRAAFTVQDAMTLGNALEQAAMKEQPAKTVPVEPDEKRFGPFSRALIFYLIGAATVIGVWVWRLL
jgi:hypothetical protein